MAKLKNPLLSLDARGSLASSISFTHRRGLPVLEKKPIPTDQQTLAQMYQRWLYENYAYLWTQQSLATKQSYNSLGSRHHLTGFQYWMKYQLTNLPDIVGYWKLDNMSGALAYDASRNALHGTIFGVTPSAGLIDGGAYADGINDYIDFGLANPANFTSEDFTIEFFYNPPVLNADWFLSRGRFNQDGWLIYMRANGGASLYIERPGDRRHITLPAGSVTAGIWQHLTFQKYAATGKAFLNAIDLTLGVPALIDCLPSTKNLYLFRDDPGGVFNNSYCDQLIIYNRRLDHSEILRHSLRRYP